MVYLDDGQMTLTDPSGAAQHFRWKAGHVKWDPAGGQHVSENVGDKPFTVVEIEGKQPGSKTPLQFPALDPVEPIVGANQMRVGPFLRRGTTFSQGMRRPR